MSDETKYDFEVMMKVAARGDAEIAALEDRITALEALALELAGVLDGARGELFEAEDKFLVFYYNTRDDHPDKPHMRRLSDRMNQARCPIVAALSTPLLSELRAKDAQQ